MLLWLPVKRMILMYTLTAQPSQASSWKTFPSDSTMSPFSATLPQVGQGPLFPQVGEGKFSIWCMVYLIPHQYALRRNSWPTSSCGIVYASRSACGPKPVFLARPPKSSHISEPLWRKLKSLTIGLTTSMWIWWVPFLLHRVSPICLLWWIALPVGQKQFSSPQQTLSHVPTRWLPNGSLTSVCLWTFPPIEGHSLHPSCGLPSRSHWEPSFTTPTTTTHRPMALWSGSTVT